MPSNPIFKRPPTRRDMLEQDYLPPRNNLNQIVARFAKQIELLKRRGA